MQFSWLHLTDLHRGMPVQQWLGQNVFERVLDDFAYLHPLTGPWDLLLFTGDLTNKGLPAQFAEADALLARLRTWIAEHQGGRQPLLLAVPGNHDLQRPADDDEGLNSLKDWAPGTQWNFWNKNDSVVRKTVDTAFSNYSAWWARQVDIGENQANGIRDYRPGLLPGDFSATIENEGGCRLGILGLNTAFLQLTGDDYKGRLALHTRQFQAVCGGDGPAWARQHNACLLLTHHPHEWLDADSRQHLEGEITDHGRFALHLCGHLHEPRGLLTALDFTQPKLLFQGRSLFGLETYGERQERLHGYAAGRIDLGQDPGAITLWPRAAVRQGNELDLDRDPGQRLRKGEDHTEPYRFALARPCKASVLGGRSIPPRPPSTDGNPAPALAETIDKLLQHKAVVPLRRCLAERLKNIPETELGQALCREPPMDALMIFRGAADACRRGLSDDEWTGDLQRAARGIFGWLLGRFVRELKPTDRLAVEIRVGTEEGAEVLWMHWLGTDEPPRFKVVGERLIGEHNVLGGARLPEAGWNWKVYVHEAKLGLWDKLLRYVPPPAAFGPKENQQLANALHRDRLSLGDPPHYATLDRSRCHDPLDDPDCLDALRRDIGLPILFIDASEDRLFAIDEGELRNTISQCVHTIDGKRP